MGWFGNSTTEAISSSSSRRRHRSSRATFKSRMAGSIFCTVGLASSPTCLRSRSRRAARSLTSSPASPHPLANLTSSQMSTTTAADKTTFIEPFAVDYDLAAGIMKNPTNRLARRASDMRGHYRDAAALDALIAEGDPVHYEVFEHPVPNEYGHLMYCI